MLPTQFQRGLVHRRGFRATGSGRTGVRRPGGVGTAGAEALEPAADRAGREVEFGSDGHGILAALPASAHGTAQGCREWSWHARSSNAPSLAISAKLGSHRTAANRRVAIPRPTGMSHIRGPTGCRVTAAHPGSADRIPFPNPERDALHEDHSLCNAFGVDERGEGRSVFPGWRCAYPGLRCVTPSA
jgi:hypothetical protein